MTFEEVMAELESLGKEARSFFNQRGALKDHRILFTHMQSFLFFVGQSILYMYLTPYFNQLGLQASMVSFYIYCTV